MKELKFICGGAEEAEMSGYTQTQLSFMKKKLRPLRTTSGCFCNRLHPSIQAGMPWRHLFSIRIVLMLREMALYKWPLVQVVWPFQHAKPALEPAPCQATEGEWPLQAKLPKLFFPVHQRIRPSKRCGGGRRSALQHSPHCLHAAISHRLRQWAASGHLAIFNNIKIIL